MTKATHIYAFDDCLLNVEQNLLLVDSVSVHLDPKEFALLTYMVRNPERVLEKDELLKAGWDEQFVEEGRLTQVVHSLRNKIGHSYIETVRNAGYRFNAQVLDKSSISDEECPWVGLGAFDESQAEYFFGRDEEIKILSDRLMKERFIAIIGSSGRGKSSIVNAGVIPFLRRNAVAGQEWKTIVLRPTHLPLRSLAMSLLELADAYPTEEATNELMQKLLSDLLTLTRSVAASAEDSRKPTLLVVDQFEEVFSPYVTNRDKEGFIANLLNAVSSENFYAVVTIRTDFLQQIEAHADLWRLVSDHQHGVWRLSREDLRRLIEGPATAVGLELDKNLMDEILDDLGDEPGSLPLLSHTMVELFKLRDGVKLTFSDYRGIGKVTGAIAHHADSVFTSLSRDEQTIARRILIKLTDVGLRSGRDVGRRVVLEDLISNPTEYQAVWQVVEKLSDRRLLTIGAEHEGFDSGEKDRRAWVEFSHLALSQHWRRLARWLNKKRHALRTFHSLDAEAKEWQLSDRDPEFLYAGHRLEDALKERGSYEEFIEDVHSQFLEASEESVERVRQADRQRLKRKQQVKWLSAGLTLLGLVLLLALWEWRDTKRQRDVADSLRRAADSISQLSTDPELSILLAIESGKLTLTRQTEAALRQALAAARVRTVYIGHEKQIISVDLSRDGRYLLTGGLDQVVRVWDVATGRTTRTIGNQSGGFYWAAFSPDATQVVTASRDGAARLWDVNSGQLIREFRSHPAGSEKKNSVNHAIFSPWRNYHSDRRRGRYRSNME